MSGMIEFILERYNYWIFIILMMIGLYTVISRGNLVKKIIGLNLFQTSVFIFYISIGKIAGGTAPIFVGGHGDDGHGDGHGGGHGAAGYDEAGETHATGDHAATNAVEAAADNHGAGSQHADFGANPADVTAAAPAHADADKIVNDLHAGAGNKIFSDASPGEGFSVDADPAKLANALPKPGDAAHAEEAAQSHGAADGADPASEPHDAAATAHDATHAASDAAHAAAEVIYTNPLPHVLILTAIVVGVATTAVGLALAVRIREAYGTIEEDELEAVDNVAEFGASAEGGAA